MKMLLSFLAYLLCFDASAQIKVNSGHRYLEDSNGKPFFWMGDTAWELLHRLNRDETELYLETRRRQGFNVIQLVALAFANEDDNRKPNRYGDFPFVNHDPSQVAITPGQTPANPNEYDYWDHVDFVMQTAARKGMYIAFNPTWGDQVSHHWSADGVIFNEQNARTYGQFLGKRYASQWNIIWVLGGDCPPIYKTKDGKHYDDRPVWRALAAGIKTGEGSRRHLMTYHPKGATSSSQLLHGESWLDMNAFQSGHGSRDVDAWNWVTRDLGRQPPKPTLDMEPCYEDHPINPWDGKWTRQRGYFRAYDIRSRLYRSVFAGMCGFTYGHQQVWQFLDTTRFKPLSVGDTLIGWQRALHAEAAGEVQYLKRLMLSRPYFSRIPDQQLIVSEKGHDYRDLIVATRDSMGSYAMIYLPQSRPVTIDMSKLSGKEKRAWWYNPRTGHSQNASEKVVNDALTVTPPTLDNDQTPTDWVLVIDDAAKKYKRL
ncbi:glycoside hydrolase family 140 protein [Spirosoma sp. SC4-14]|uniref:glycoside hydrolase family 140 protein n=1 Tax=Spirosoma sp. SC4-14 TaxID=3128900 RepID=UPI0030D2EDF2